MRLRFFFQDMASSFAADISMQRANRQRTNRRSIRTRRLKRGSHPSILAIVSKEAHWENVYSTKTDREVSWTQTDPRTSLLLVNELLRQGRVIDVGGGTSVLADRLLEAGYAVTVLDISQAALLRAQRRLGDKPHTFAGSLLMSQPSMTLAISTCGTTARFSTS